MKFFIKYLFLFIPAFVTLHSKAQSGKLPPFRMVQANGKVFKAENLPMGKPIVIVYFSPGCDHCEEFTAELKKNIAQFRKASIAMVTYWAVADLKKFSEKFSLNQYSNVYTGTEGNSFFLRNYYKIAQMPFAALYTKEGSLVKTWQSHIPINELTTKLKQLK